MRSFGGRRFRNGKVKGKLPDWRSANSHLSFVGGWEVATKKEHLVILAQTCLARNWKRAERNEKERRNESLELYTRHSWDRMRNKLRWNIKKHDVEEGEFLCLVSFKSI